MNYKKMSKADLLEEAFKLKNTNNQLTEQVETLKNKVTGVENSSALLKVGNATQLKLITEIQEELPTSKFWWWNAIKVIKKIIDLIELFFQDSNTEKIDG